MIVTVLIFEIATKAEFLTSCDFIAIFENTYLKYFYLIF